MRESCGKRGEHAETKATTMQVMEAFRRRGSFICPGRIGGLCGGGGPEVGLTGRKGHPTGSVRCEMRKGERRRGGKGGAMDISQAT